MKLLKNKKGLTLLEIILAVAILSIVIVPLTNNFIVSMKMEDTAKNDLKAINLAQLAMENIKSRDLVYEETEIFDDGNDYNPYEIYYDITKATNYTGNVAVTYPDEDAIPVDPTDRNNYLIDIKINNNESLIKVNNIYSSNNIHNVKTIDLIEIYRTGDYIYVYFYYHNKKDPSIVKGYLMFEYKADLVISFYIENNDQPNISINFKNDFYDGIPVYGDKKKGDIIFNDEPGDYPINTGGLGTGTGGTGGTVSISSYTIQYFIIKVWVERNGQKLFELYSDKKISTYY